MEERGAAGFTTNHVAERAGVSVGSLYQYFPNKAALLRALLERENDRTLGRLAQQLSNPELEPAARMRSAIHAFFRTEAEEVALRGALIQAEAYFGTDLDTRAMAREQIHMFLVSARLVRDPEDRFPADLVTTAVSSVAEDVTARRPADLQRWADAVADMLLGWLARQRDAADVKPA